MVQIDAEVQRPCASGHQWYWCYKSQPDHNDSARITDAAPTIATSLKLWRSRLRNKFYFFESICGNVSFITWSKYPSSSKTPSGLAGFFWTRMGVLSRWHDSLGYLEAAYIMTRAGRGEGETRWRSYWVTSIISQKLVDCRPNRTRGRHANYVMMLSIFSM